uniref:Uncharacterized protein n=1 Tax=Triticum urartu TaxID=4572 RepID=A0A8R7QA53_TRIUA
MLRMDSVQGSEYTDLIVVCLLKPNIGSITFQRGTAWSTRASVFSPGVQDQGFYSSDNILSCNSAMIP